MSSSPTAVRPLNKSSSVTLVIDHLTERDVIEPGLLYETPFIYLAPEGPEQVFDLKRTNRLFRVI